MTARNDRKSARATDLVAREANVSRVAVSRAFNPNASLKPEKRDRILQIARELNYTPDRAARSLVTRRSHLVGMIVPDVCSPWESQEIDALTTALQAEGFATLLFKAKADFSMDQTLLTYMRGFNPDSVIAFTENVDADIEAPLSSEDFSFMLLAKPGCYALIGNGDGGHRDHGHGLGPCMLHNTSYDFNDNLLPIGATYWVRLTERLLALTSQD